MGALHRELELILNLEVPDSPAAADLCAAECKRVEHANRLLVAGRLRLHVLPVVLDTEVIDPLAPGGRAMAEANLAVGLNTGVRALGQIEFRDALIQAVAAAEVDVAAQFLSVGQRVLDFEIETGPRIRLRDQHREQALGPRRANRLLFQRVGALDRQRHAGPVAHQRAIDGPGVLPRLPRWSLV